MAHNSLRRELAAALDAIRHPPAPDLSLDCAWAARLFDRCLNALGGPVVDERPPISVTPVQAAVRAELGLLPVLEGEVLAEDIDHDLIRLGSDGH